MIGLPYLSTTLMPVLNHTSPYLLSKLPAANRILTHVPDQHVDLGELFLGIHLDTTTSIEGNDWRVTSIQKEARVRMLETCIPWRVSFFFINYVPWKAVTGWSHKRYKFLKLSHKVCFIKHSPTKCMFLYKKIKFLQSGKFLGLHPSPCAPFCVEVPPPLAMMHCHW